MESQTENKPVEVRGDLVYFIVATFFTFPFVIALGSFALVPGNGNLFSSDLGVYLFSSPMPLSLSILDFLFIFFAWLWSPYHWRFILPFYAFFIVGYWICSSRMEFF
jgi:hypothetical protein